jgi:hypothetical protein
MINNLFYFIIYYFYLNKNLYIIREKKESIPLTEG